jgi:hypothetical protein
MTVHTQLVVGYGTFTPLFSLLRKVVTTKVTRVINYNDI